MLCAGNGNHAVRGALIFLYIYIFNRKKTGFSPIVNPAICKWTFLFFLFFFPNASVNRSLCHLAKCKLKWIRLPVIGIILKERYSGLIVCFSWIASFYHFVFAVPSSLQLTVWWLFFFFNRIFSFEKIKALVKKNNPSLCKINPSITFWYHSIVTSRTSRMTAKSVENGKKNC